MVMAADGEPGQELHSVHAYDPHEVMHALVHKVIGEPPAFFDGGPATAFGWDWTPGEKDVHQRAGTLLHQGRLVPLKRLLTNWDFRSYKSYPAYTTAGSFIKYVLAVHGPEKLVRLLQLEKYSRQEEIEECFATAYASSIYKVEDNWRAELGAGTLIAAAPSSSLSETSYVALALTGVILLAVTFLGAMVVIRIGEKVAGAAFVRMRTLVRTVSRQWRPRRSQ